MNQWLGNCCYMCVYYTSTNRKCPYSNGPYDYCSDFVLNDLESIEEPEDSEDSFNS